MIWKVTTQMEWSQPLFWAFPHQYLKFLSKLFCSILYTYAEVFYTHVSQSVMCNPSAVKEPIWCLIEQSHSHYKCQYLELLGKLFCSTLCTYAKVFCTHVPQSFVCNPFAMGVNLFKHQIGSCAANTEECAVNSVFPASIHIGLWDTTKTNIFIGVNICYGWFNIWWCNLAQIWL